MRTKICKEVNSLGCFICPHCGSLAGSSLTVEVENKPVICWNCGKNYLISGDIKKIADERTEKLQKTLDKVRCFAGMHIENICLEVDRTCDINEVALLCRYFGCSIVLLAAKIKTLRY